MTARLASLPLLALLVLPPAALLIASTSGDLLAGLRHPRFAQSLLLSLRTSLVAMVILVLLGTPMAWWLGRGRGAGRRAVEAMVDLPMVLPPAVLGLGLILAFGRDGLGGLLGLKLAFTEAAVVLAQVLVAAPFFVQSAAAAFARVDDEVWLVAQTLGATPWEAFRRVALPAAMPGLIGGLALAWARALGEFGATLLFAGSLPGRTQTMPLAIYSAMELDLNLAVALAIVAASAALVLLWALRSGSVLRGRR